MYPEKLRVERAVTLSKYRESEHLVRDTAINTRKVDVGRSKNG